MRLAQSRLFAGAILALAVVLTTVAGPAAPGLGRSTNVVTPGSFRGFGFDQCLAPSQRSMNRWLKQSPYLAVGIYISGASRGCRDQPNLTPRWISAQLTKGWRLLPITLGPQASCNPRFPRYGNDPVIVAKPGKNGRYPHARRQGSAEAASTVDAARALGIVGGSTLWYDLEGFDVTNSRCRESSLAFLSTWTHELHAAGYVSGVYSSAGSGIKMLDDARVNRPGTFHLPDRIWIARWDGVGDTSTSYIRGAGWRPGNRMKQYVGGHDETWGGVRINIDRDFLNLGTPAAAAETHCAGVTVDLPTYRRIDRTHSDRATVKALQCLLTEQQVYAGRLNGRWSPATIAAANRWQTAHDLPARAVWTRRHWMTLLATGAHPVLKFGSTGSRVRALQRTLLAADGHASVALNGVFAERTDAALRTWQHKLGLTSTGVANPSTWKWLAAGQRGPIS
ncbi:MAG: glycoside hydrolase domain-containing protein [Nocardioides sp.]